MKLIGVPYPRTEDDRFLRGRGTYVADLLPLGTAHAKFVRSPYAHARIRRIDIGPAKRAPDVLAAVTGADLKGILGSIPAGVPSRLDARVPPYPVLGIDRVRYAGEAVAVVVAADPYAATDAAELVNVDYESLPVIVDQEAAIREGAPTLHPEAPDNIAFRYRRAGGDIDKAIRAADVVVERRIVNQRLQPSAIEPRAALADWNPEEDRLTLWVTSQNPRDEREVLSEVLKVPERRIRVVSPDVGGGFGSKVPVYPTSAVLAQLARTLKRPVKWVETRMENFQATTHGRDHVQYVRLAARRDGTILGLDVRSIANLGAYVSTAGAIVPSVSFGPMLSGCYRIPAGRVEVLGVFTNTTPVDAYRGAGRPEACYLVERIVDILARRLGLDPVAIRRRNFIPKETFPYRAWTRLTYDSGDYEATLSRALELVGYDRFREKQARARTEGRLLGLGLSTYVEMCGAGPGLKGTSRVRVNPSGKVTVYTGGHPHGQGEETTFAQIVAEELGVPLEDIEVIHGDTEAVPRGVGTFGSRTAAVEGSSVVMSARRVVDKAKGIAARMLETAEADVAFEEGKFFVRGVPWKSLTIQEVAAKTVGEEGSAEERAELEAAATFDPPDFTFPFGAHVCLVEVDPETGAVRIIRYVAVDDCGNVINPTLVEGQVHGGVLQGIAQALLEAAVYDEHGNLLTSTFLDYAVPTALEAPVIETDRTVTPSPHNPLGLKGVGEAGSIAAPPAVVNAVVDALAPLGLEHIDMPLTPERVWRAIREGTPRT